MRPLLEPSRYAFGSLLAHAFHEARVRRVDVEHPNPAGAGVAKTVLDAARRREERAFPTVLERCFDHATRGIPAVTW